MWGSAVQKVSSGGSGFDPSFSETEKVRSTGASEVSEEVMTRSRV